MADELKAGQATKIWTCKIGEISQERFDNLPQGLDFPMRCAIGEAYKKITGVAPNFCFSGWSGKLTEPERVVVENREPVRPAAEGQGVEGLRNDILALCAYTLDRERCCSGATADGLAFKIEAALASAAQPAEPQKEAVMYPARTVVSPGATISQSGPEQGAIPPADIPSTATNTPIYAELDPAKGARWYMEVPEWARGPLEAAREFRADFERDKAAAEEYKREHPQNVRGEVTDFFTPSSGQLLQLARERVFGRPG
jgi:hypothetical protein